MIAFAYGELGIEQDVLLHRMTFADYQIKAYYHARRQDEAYKLSWEQTRYIAFSHIVTQTDKVRTPQQLMPFPWEQPENKPLTKRQQAKRRKEMDAIIEGHMKYFKNIKPQANA